MTSFTSVALRTVVLPAVLLFAAGCGNDEPSVDVDATAPTTSLATTLPAFVAHNVATFKFSSDDVTARFECKLDGDDFSSCESPATFAKLAEGKHEFLVRAVNEAGIADANPPSVSWTVDTLPPQVTVDSGPTGAVSAPQATFTFASNEPDVRMLCRLDGGIAVPCESPWSITALSEGAHTFTVRALDRAGNMGPEAPQAAWTVDTAAPQTTLSSAPGLVSTATPAFAFVSSEAGKFECSVDSTAFAACASPLITSALGEGAHSLEVRAVDAAGNRDPSPASAVFTVDTTAPGTSLTSSIAASVNTSAASFTFVSTDPATFECSLDGAAFSGCSSPAAYGALPAGGHTFAVRAVDAAGNRDASPATAAWTIDQTPPDTVFTSTPGAATPSASAQFLFSSTETGATFECRLDAGAFAACTAPVTFSNLSGSHTFTVRAVDAAGNRDVTPATSSWTVDAVAPQTTLTSTMAALVSTTTASFSFTSDEPGTFECSLDAAAFSACTSPAQWAGLLPGPHTFAVRAVDLAGNIDATSPQAAWSIDIGDPDTVIVDGPPALATDPWAQFVFSSDDGAATFECRLDGGVYEPCTTPYSYLSLSEGGHDFDVRAVDAAGNRDATPASRQWSVDSVLPETSITAGPTGAVSSTSAAFSFTSSKTATFECSFDGGPYTNCTSPVTYTNLPEGPHSFGVQAIDSLGRVDLSPTIANWRVDTIPPDAFFTGFSVFFDQWVSVTDATFAFGTNEYDVTFECNLNGNGFEFCPSPVTVTSLADGLQVLEVRAVDAAGNRTPSPSWIQWNVDTTPPETTLVSGPAALTNSTSAAFSFSINEPGGFECTLDGSVTNCPSPFDASNLVDGVHVFSVRAYDGLGTFDPTPETFTWTVDATPPDTLVTGGMPVAVSTTTASIAFASIDSGSTFQCRLNGSAFTTCVSPAVYAGLLPGAQFFEVRAVDQAGNVDATPASVSWEIDQVPPTSYFTVTPPSPDNQSTATFGFGASEAATARCRLDGSAYGTCTSPLQVSGLTDGSHVFDVYAIDTVGNAEPVALSYAWTVDLTPPDTLIASGPPSPVSDTTALFYFMITEPGNLECSVDGGGFASCTSPELLTALASGTHEFAVRAIDDAGNIDATPEVWSWVVDTIAPTVSFTNAPPAFTTSSEATFAFSSTDSTGAYECALDAGAFADCSSLQVTYMSLAEGPHRFTLVTADTLDNRTVVTTDWQIDMTPPDTLITSSPPALTNSTLATLQFAADEPVSKFECSLDGAAFQACSSPASYTGITEGTHTFVVRAVDFALLADPSPASVSWQADPTPPVIRFTSVPGAVTNSATVAFGLASNEAAPIRCAVDGAGVAPCSATVVLPALSLGRHTAMFWAVDDAGNWSTPLAYDVTVVAPSALWRSVSAGGDFACGVKFDTTLWCWGTNKTRQLGDSNLTHSAGPVPLAGAGWREVASGTDASCAIKNDATLWCWGKNYYGQLGNGTYAESVVPVLLGGDWLRVYAGESYFCAHKLDLELYCWGTNREHQLGDVLSDAIHVTPTPQLVAEAGRYQSVSPGRYGTCALGTEGIMHCWGWQDYGGNSLADQNVRSGVGSAWMSLSVGINFACGIKSDRSLWCWGAGRDYPFRPEPGGHLLHGGGDVGPAQVGSEYDWDSVEVRLDANHVCALKTDATLWCWGSNDAGAAAQGTTATSPVPRLVGSSSDTWAVVSMGHPYQYYDGHDLTCAIKLDGELSCWGANNFGSVGAGITGLKTSPTQVGIDSNWLSVKPSLRQTCGVRTDGAVWCWGQNTSGELGDGTRESRQNLVRVGTDADWIDVMTLTFQSCGLKADFSVWCWGNRTYDSPTLRVPAAWAAVSGTGGQWCGSWFTGELWCTGNSFYAGFRRPDGQTDWANPATATSLAITDGRSCAIKPDHTLWCWESSWLDIGAVPVQIGAAEWSKVFASGPTVCVIKVDGTLWCWGQNITWDTIPEPTQIGIDADWANVAPMYQSTCAVKTTGTLWCLGWNSRGEMGIGTLAPQLLGSTTNLQQVGTDSDWATVASDGFYSVCAIKTTGTLWCWGDNTNGQLGTGDAWFDVPTLVY